jgi:hypothetical protein
MVELASGVEEAGGDIISLDVGVLRENLLRGLAGSQELEHIDDSDTHASDARPATALLRVKRDPRQKIRFAHGFLLARCRPSRR